MTSEGFDCPGCGLHMAGFRPDPGNSWQVIVNPYDPSSLLAAQVGQYSHAHRRLDGPEQKKLRA